MAGSLEQAHGNRFVLILEALIEELLLHRLPTPIDPLEVRLLQGLVTVYYCDETMLSACQHEECIL